MENKRQKRLKRLGAAALAAAVVLGGTGCGTAGAEAEGETQTASPAPLADSGAGEEGAPKDSKDTEGAPAAQEDAPEKTGAPAQASAEPAQPDRSGVFELLAGMTVGWNLGNTLDAHGAGNTLASETYWGNPETTKEMIDAIAAQGINTVRIPVTWGEHLGSGPDYLIDEAWLDRVEEVVDYCLEDGMYVILDTHHETNYWLSLDEEDLDQTAEELKAIWTQIAERFKDRDSHLLFEGMNEPRTQGSAGEWSGGTPNERGAVNRLNGVFLDAVRATGGENATRCLILCTYGNNASLAAMRDLKRYDDPNIAVALHLYTPYVFTFEGEGHVSVWDGSLQKDLDTNLRQIQSQFIAKGMPVIVTEFGAVNKGNTEDVVRWLEGYLGAMNQYQIKCVWWDNGIYEGDGECFGIFDRNNLTWYSPEVADALVEYAAQE